MVTKFIFKEVFSGKKRAVVGCILANDMLTEKKFGVFNKYKLIQVYAMPD